MMSGGMQRGRPHGVREFTSMQFNARPEEAPSITMSKPFALTRLWGLLLMLSGHGPMVQSRILWIQLLGTKERTNYLKPRCVSSNETLLGEMDCDKIRTYVLFHSSRA